MSLIIIDKRGTLPSSARVTAVLRNSRSSQRRPGLGGDQSPNSRRNLVRMSGFRPSEPFAFNGELDRSRPKAAVRFHQLQCQPLPKAVISVGCQTVSVTVVGPICSGRVNKDKDTDRARRVAGNTQGMHRVGSMVLSPRRTNKLAAPCGGLRPRRKVV